MHKIAILSRKGGAGKTTLAVHLAAAAEDVPDLLHAAVAAGPGARGRRKPEVRRAPARERQQHPHLRAVGRSGVGLGGQGPGGEARLALPAGRRRGRHVRVPPVCL